AKQLAADLLEANPDDVVLDAAGGRFHVAGTPAIGKDWAELSAAAAADGGTLVVEHVFNSTGATFPSGAHVAVVEIDTDTGKVTLQRLIAVDDAGRILNPLIAEGQVHGGLAQGAAQALLEEMVYDPEGNPVTSNFADYAFVSTQELPTFEIVHLETPTPLNELGAKGIGESGTIGATPAVQNAVVDAVSHLGITHIDMPCTAERVWRAIQEASAR
ncbi:MAG: molybdopterin-dependent oxidoreductase, partial [Actinomycetota bacterium]|nr:molybdopterin-dependent oxidoreductase [Actinomycetota bacterium]